ncbi:MAG: glycerate kinase [Acidobacteria bacterium]|nr:glycerate kinase [Acidobacteriota bacterium]
MRRLETELKRLYGAALKAADPGLAIKNLLKLKGNVLQVGRRRYPLEHFRRVLVIGAGKACYPMARVIEQVLGSRLHAGVIVTKYGYGGRLRRIGVLEAGHPEADQAGLRAARRLIGFIENHVCAEDLVIALWSGGGSALLPAPPSNISLKEKRATTAALLKCGASIHELNAVRKHLSRLKGGRLIDIVSGARVVVLALSDVVGDDFSSIASGPLVPDPTTYEECLTIIRKYGLGGRLPRRVISFLEKGSQGVYPETPKPGDPRFQKVHYELAGNNCSALRAAAAEARRAGLRPLLLSSSLEGSTTEIARFHVAIAREILSTGLPLPPPCCVISGGETTVEVKGDGKGGRNQEFVLRCVQFTSDWSTDEVLFASIGSDGTDGSTEAAGAFAFSDLGLRAHSKGVVVDDYLRRNDSYHFFKRMGGLIVTGPTRTNVMDFRFILIRSHSRL